MSHLPINPLSSEEQQKVMEQMYWLCGKQVQSYHKHWHMGSNSSVPVDLAQELMESIEYTIGLVGGVYAHRNIGEALLLGQEILESKLSKAKILLELVNGTAPRWQTECRWDALRYLRHYLDHYDHLHLAHKGPEDLFYPILISPPEGIKGIDNCLLYLNILWIENQIMAAFPEDALEQLWSRLPTDTLNQCEQVVCNSIGKVILYDRSDDLVFMEAEREELRSVLSMQPVKEAVNHAVFRLCHRLKLSEDGSAYLDTAAAQMMPRLETALQYDNMSVIFR